MLAIIAILAVIYYAVSNQIKKQISPLAQTVSVGTVAYEATPKNLSKSASIWDFEIVLDTHEGSLDQDLTQLAVLLDDKGREYKPVKWDGDPPGGHHRTGVLQFKTPDSDTQSITLKINPGIRFTWDLK